MEPAFTKRLFDLVVASIGLFLLSPLFIFIAAWIKLDSHGPVFYPSERVGKDGRLFRVYKFRTMVPEASLIGPSLTVDEDPRVTRAGRFLRKYKLDELPQLVNVVLGEMSIVGPRPEVRKYVDMFKDDYKRILQVRPGITDLASLKYVNEAELLGKYDDPETAYVKNILPEKIRLAHEYLNQASLLCDVKLIFKTIVKIFSGAASLAL
jgi:lipopolysaccharide/colanic/teichoic acid biosynthesis glycosyltransferase